MKFIFLMGLFFLSWSASATSIHQFSYVDRVFNSLVRLEPNAIPGLIRFQYGEDFYFKYSDDTDCRNIPARSIVRKVSDYLEALNEMDRASFDLKLFGRQFLAVLGDSDYLMCERTKATEQGVRTDIYFFSRANDYRLWITEITAE